MYDSFITEETTEQSPNKHFEAFDFEAAFPNSTSHLLDELTAQDRDPPDIEAGTLDLGVESQADLPKATDNVGMSYLDRRAEERAKPTKSPHSRKPRTRNLAGDVVPHRKMTRRSETSKRSRSKSHERRIAVAEKERLVREAMTRDNAFHNRHHSATMSATPSGNIGVQYEYMNGVLQVKMPTDNPSLNPQWPDNFPEASAAFSGSPAYCNSYDM
jgi:hypothetical protein